MQSKQTSHFAFKELWIVLLTEFPTFETNTRLLSCWALWPSEPSLPHRNPSILSFSRRRSLRAVFRFWSHLFQSPLWDLGSLHEKCMFLKVLLLGLSCLTCLLPGWPSRALHTLTTPKPTAPPPSPLYTQGTVCLLESRTHILYFNFFEIRICFITNGNINNFKENIH